MGLRQRSANNALAAAQANLRLSHPVKGHVHRSLGDAVHIDKLRPVRTVAICPLREVTRLEAVAAKAESKKRAYAELNTRIALLENRKRSKTITEQEFKEQLAKFRQELGQ